MLKPRCWRIIFIIWETQLNYFLNSTFKKRYQWHQTYHYFKSEAHHTFYRESVASLEYPLHPLMRSGVSPPKSPTETTNSIFTKTLYSTLHIPFVWAACLLMNWLWKISLEHPRPQSMVRSPTRCSSISFHIPGMLFVFFWLDWVIKDSQV